jgi:glycosyltransferase involved in cell wall biosynthesis
MVPSLTEKPISRGPEQRGRSVRMAPGIRVLILATDIFTRGGIARYTSTLASALGGTLGAENVDVLCFFSWGYEGDRPKEFGVLGMVSGSSRASMWSRLRFLFEVAKAGMRGYDLVIANHIALAPVAAAMKFFFRTPYWVACHCVEVWWGTSLWRRTALTNADVIVPVSRYTASVVQKMKGVQTSRVKVLYNAIPNDFVDLLVAQAPAVTSVAKEKKSAIMLSVCSLAQGNEFKGVDTVIRALPSVLRAMPDTRYVVVGEGEIRKSLENLAAETGVKKNISFAGEVGDAELAELYRSCDVFVLPSRGKGVRGVAGGEGFGRVYIEAALAGKPVVGSRSGGASEAVLPGKTGFVVNPESSEEIAEALITILEDPQLAARMGSEGRAWCLRAFSEDALCDSLRKLLRPYGFRNESLQTLPQPGGGL